MVLATSPTPPAWRKSIIVKPSECRKPLAITDRPTVRRYVRPSPRIAQKKVRFTMATTYEFDLAYGGSALPSETGPPIGIARHHMRVSTEDISTNSNRIGKVRKFDHFERIQLLGRKYKVQEVASFCLDAVAMRAGRMETLGEVFYEKREDDEDNDGKRAK
ncbi:hypothetical protein THRCLA_06596 [Thraustotheca clavata]|uniref:Uncharacterized protein n=1 Tax=Thraustotheca clavata TaxID=74557 RepID=A0A1V9ZMD9_9STRA|nr:hypothetical protein THRCLA_06596 [Thraustotheca clavata]